MQTTGPAADANSKRQDLIPTTQSSAAGCATPATPGTASTLADGETLNGVYMPENHWFADMMTPEDGDRYVPDAPWMAVIQAAGGCFPLDGIWFHSEADCEDFIRTEILGARLVVEGGGGPKTSDAE